MAQIDGQTNQQTNQLIDWTGVGGRVSEKYNVRNWFYDTRIYICSVIEWHLKK